MPIKNAFPMFPSGSGGSNDKSPASTSGSIALSGAWFDLQMAYQRMKSVYGGLQKMYAGRGGVPKSFADRYEALSAEYRLTGDYGETGELNAVQPTAAAEIRAKRDLTQRIVAATTDMQRALNAGGGKEKPIPEVPLPGFPHPTMGPREDGPDLPFQWGDPEGPIDRGPGIARGGDPNFDFGSSSYHGTGLGDGTASRDGGKKGFPGSSGYHGTGLDDGTARGDGTKKGFSGYQGTGLNDGMVSRKGKGTRDVSPSDGTGVFRPGTSTQGSSGSNSSQGTSSGGGSREALPSAADLSDAADDGPRTYFINADTGEIIERRDSDSADPSEQPDTGGGGTPDPEGGTDETPRMHGLAKTDVSREATPYKYGGSTSPDADRGGNNPRFMGGPSERPDPEAGGGGTPRSRDVFPSPEDTGGGNPRGLASRTSFGGARAVTRR